MPRHVLRQVPTDVHTADAKQPLRHRQHLQGPVVRGQGLELSEGEILEAGHLEHLGDLVDGAAAHDLGAEQVGAEVAFQADVDGAVVEDVGVVFAPVNVLADGLEVVGVDGGEQGRHDVPAVLGMMGQEFR